MVWHIPLLLRLIELEAQDSTVHGDNLDARRVLREQLRVNLPISTVYLVLSNGSQKT